MSKQIHSQSPLQRSQMLEPGSTSISNLPDGTICTFYGSYTLQASQVEEFEPVQCIVNHPPLPTIAPPTTPPTSSAHLTTSTPTTSFTLPTPLITSTHSTHSIFSTSPTFSTPHTSSSTPIPLTLPTSTSLPTPPTLLTLATVPSVAPQTTNAGSTDCVSLSILVVKKVMVA